jgi:thiol-disulfide isomerase/thioredoxin/thioredoxin-related protein
MPLTGLKGPLAMIFCAGLLAVSCRAEDAAQGAEPLAAPASSRELDLADGGHPNPLMRYFEVQIDAARAENKRLVFAVFNSEEPSALSKTLLPAPEWKERVLGKYILMPLDMRPALLDNAEYREMAAELGRQYPVKSIPAMIFLDDDLLPVGQIHGQTTKDGFLAALDKIESAAILRTQLREKKNALKLEEAKLLDQLFENAVANDAPPEALRGQLNDILELDAQDKAGLKTKYLPIARVMDAQFLLGTGNAAAAEAVLNEADAAALSPVWQERRMAILLDAVAQTGDAAKIEATLNAGVALGAVNKDVKQNWMARAAAALAGRGESARAEEWMKKALALDPESEFAKMVALQNAGGPRGADGKALLATHDGKRFDLDAQKGKPVVVEFWSAANRHCQTALMTLSDVAARYKGKAVFLAINVGAHDDCEALAAQMPNLLWLEDPTGLVEDRYDVKRAPYTLLIDKEGKRVNGVSGLNLYNRAVLETRLDDQLK